MKSVIPLYGAGFLAVGAAVMAWAQTSVVSEPATVMVKGVACPLVVDSDGTERVSLRDVPFAVAYAQQQKNGEVMVRCLEVEDAATGSVPKQVDGPEIFVR